MRTTRERGRHPGPSAQRAAFSAAARKLLILAGAGFFALGSGSAAAQPHHHPHRHPPPHHPPPHHPPAPAADFGDAPESDERLFVGPGTCTGVVTNYPSRFASGGPFHTDFTDLWLGPQPNTETAEPDAILPNCDDWDAPPFDYDDGPLFLSIPPASGWISIDGDGGAVFGPAPPGTPQCFAAFWTFEVSVDAAAPAGAARFANVVVDDRCPGPNGFYGDPQPPEWVLENAPVLAAPGGTQTMTTLPFFVETSCGDGAPPNCNDGLDNDVPPDNKVDEWGLLPFWTRFTVAREPIVAPPGAWNGSGPPGGFVFGETEDWLVWGDPDEGPGPTSSP